MALLLLPWYCGNIVATEVAAVWEVVRLAEEDDEQAASADQKWFLQH
jgi:hypothetical protein